MFEGCKDSVSRLENPCDPFFSLPARECLGLSGRLIPISKPYITLRSQSARPSTPKHQAGSHEPDPFLVLQAASQTLAKNLSPTPFSLGSPG